MNINFLGKKLFGLILIVIAAASLQGCAARSVKEPEIIWPEPPQEPRVAYIATYYGRIDFDKRNFLDVLLGKPPASRFNRPYGVAYAGDKLFVSDIEEGIISVLDLKEKKYSSIGDSGAKRLARPLGMALSSDGQLYVADTKIKAVYVYTKDGAYVRQIGSADTFSRPTAVAVNEAQQKVYVVDTPEHKVKVFTIKGELLQGFGQRGDKDGAFNYPTGIGVDQKSGNVYVVDTLNFRVQVFDADGKFIRKFGELGDAPGQFGRPKSVAFDSEGHVYVTESMFGNFKLYNNEGRVLLVVGGAGAGPGRFEIPSGIYIDGQDRIYVADQANGRVQIFQYLSEAWKKEHPAEYQRYLNLPEVIEKERAEKKDGK